MLIMQIINKKLNSFGLIEYSNFFFLNCKYLDVKLWNSNKSSSSTIRIFD